MSNNLRNETENYTVIFHIIMYRSIINVPYFLFVKILKDDMHNGEMKVTLNRYILSNLISIVLMLLLKYNEYDVVM